MSLQKVLKVGNSLGLTLPSNLVKNLSLKAGDQVDVRQEIDNSIVVSFPDSHQLSLGLSPKQNRHKKSI